MRHAADSSRRGAAARLLTALAVLLPATTSAASREAATTPAAAPEAGLAGKEAGAGFRVRLGGAGAAAVAAAAAAVRRLQDGDDCTGNTSVGDAEAGIAQYDDPDACLRDGPLVGCNGEWLVMVGDAECVCCFLLCRCCWCDGCHCRTRLATTVSDLIFQSVTLYKSGSLFSLSLSRAGSHAHALWVVWSNSAATYIHTALRCPTKRGRRWLPSSHHLTPTTLYRATFSLFILCIFFYFIPRIYT